ncbi:MAG: serine hydrolase [Chloroflexi bacterium]|nr:serine hydrolase [Chloroflexota bacterium]
MHRIQFLFLGAILVLLAGCARATATPSPAPQLDSAGYFPTQGWRTSSPEAQGMDSAALLKLFDEIQTKQLNVHSVVIARHGFIVAEAYWRPFQPGARHVLDSCTKSVNSALVGIAIKQGKIANVNQRVLDFFPERAIANGSTALTTDARKQAMTLEHLLTMSSGMDWNETGVPISAPNNSNRQMLQSKDWVQFVLDRPMKEQPGTGFNYNSGGAHLVSAILQKATGMSELAFAQEYLFKPLGISDVSWTADPNGIYRGEDGLELTARDMAKIGYLYLKGGAWDGQQIVTSDWIQQSSRKHIPATGELSYGYQWWAQPFNAYNAAGRGSQYIFVLPDLDLVVVFTAGLKTAMFDLPASLVETFIIPASKPEPLPANATTADALAARLQSFGQPEPKAMLPLPSLAQAVSGRTYILDDDALGWRAFALSFKEGAAVFRVMGEKPVEMAVGLDNVYRTTRVEARGDIALRGFWQNDKTFVMQFQGLNEADRLDYTFTFDKDVVDVRVTAFIDGNTAQARGKAQN